MERDSLLYKTRRKLQVIARRFFSDEFLSKFYFKLVVKEKLNLKEPRTFNEKMQWLKLNRYANSETVARCADKYAVRKYVEEKGYGDSLTSLLGVWDCAEEIVWDDLPNQFVLKCNHGCAYNILCPDKTKFDKKGAQKRLNAWLKEDFGSFNIELHYSRIKPRKIICEEFLGDCITDYKFFCFNGEPHCVYVSNDLIHDRQARIGFFDLDGNKMALKRDDYADFETVEFPAFFGEMRQIAKDLAADFPFVRVDFFIANDRFYFAELTFTPSACMMPFNPKKFDLEWGEMLDIQR